MDAQGDTVIAEAVEGAEDLPTTSTNFSIRCNHCGHSVGLSVTGWYNVSERQ